jgi:hypothetical protein
LFIGTTHDTPHFAVDNLVRWWNYHGHRHYPAKDFRNSSLSITEIP